MILKVTFHGSTLRLYCPGGIIWNFGPCFVKRKGLDEFGNKEHNSLKSVWSKLFLRIPAAWYKLIFHKLSDLNVKSQQLDNRSLGKTKVKHCKIYVSLSSTLCLVQWKALSILTRYWTDRCWKAVTIRLRLTSSTLKHFTIVGTCSTHGGYKCTTMCAARLCRMWRKQEISERRTGLLEFSYLWAQHF